MWKRLSFERAWKDRFRDLFFFFFFKIGLVNRRVKRYRLMVSRRVRKDIVVVVGYRDLLRLFLYIFFLILFVLLERVNEI